MIILNSSNVPIRVDTSNIILDSKFLMELGCKIWLDDSRYNRHAKNHGLNLFDFKSDFMFLTLTSEGDYLLGNYSSLRHIPVRSYSFEIFIKNLTGDWFFENMGESDGNSTN